LIFEGEIPDGFRIIRAMILKVMIHVVIVAAIVALSFWAFGGGGSDAIQDAGSGQGSAEELIQRKDTIKDEAGAIGRGAVVFLVAGAYLAYLFLKFLLPKFTGAVSGMMIGESVAPPEIEEADAMREARVAVAQGDFEKAVEAYGRAMEETPDQRMPVVERAKVQLENLEDAEGAIDTYRTAMENEWEVDDAAFFMFRLAELYEEKLGDFDAAKGIYEQVLEAFPETRHSANANHKLRELEAAASSAIESGAEEA